MADTAQDFLDKVNENSVKLTESGHEYFLVLCNQQQSWQIGSSKGRQFLEDHVDLLQKFFEHCYSAAVAPHKHSVYTLLTPKEPVGMVTTAPPWTQTTQPPQAMWMLGAQKTNHMAASWLPGNHVTSPSWIPNQSTVSSSSSSWPPSVQQTWPSQDAAFTPNTLDSLTNFPVGNSNVVNPNVQGQPPLQVKDKVTSHVLSYQGQRLQEQNHIPSIENQNTVPSTNLNLAGGKLQEVTSGLSWTPLNTPVVVTPKEIKTSGSLTQEMYVTESSKLQNVSPVATVNDENKSDDYEESEDDVDDVNDVDESRNDADESRNDVDESRNDVRESRDDVDESRDDVDDGIDESDDKMSVGFEMDNDLEEGSEIVQVVNKVVSSLDDSHLMNIKQEPVSTPLKTKGKNTRKENKYTGIKQKKSAKKPAAQKRQGALPGVRRSRRHAGKGDDSVYNAETDEEGNKEEEDKKDEDYKVKEESDNEDGVDEETNTKVSCKFCSQSFLNPSNLTRHERRKHGSEKKECRRCGKEIKIHSFAKHMISAHNVKHKEKTPVDKEMLKCEICNEYFTNQYNLRRHLKTHTSTQRFHCTVCDKSFCRKDVLKEHMQKHSGERPFSCKVCKKSFFSMAILRGHEKTHLDVKDFLCLTCGKSFVQKYKLGVHMKNCHGEKQYKCKKCQTRFLREAEYQEHDCPGYEDGEKSDSDFPCNICGKVFQKRRNMLIHRRLHNIVQPKHQCTICNRLFRERCNLTKHVRYVHSETRNFVCDICGKSFKQNDTLKNHYKIHGPEKTKDFQCDECGKYLSGNTALTVHKRSHSGAKPFMCDICGMAFRQSGNMTKHMLIHTSRKFYRCELCGNEYKYQETWKAHMRGHAIKEGLVPEALTTKYGKVYNCEYCGKKVSTASQYKVHLRTHTNERPFSCDLCEKAFKEKGKLTRHMKKVHFGNSCDEMGPQSMMQHPVPVKKTQNTLHNMQNAVPQTLIHAGSGKKMHLGVGQAEEQMVAHAQPIVHAINVDNQVIKTYINLQSEPVMYYNMG